MRPSDRMPSGAMFDVKPVDGSGSLDFEVINSIKPTVNLTSFRPKKSFKAKKAVLRQEEPIEFSREHPEPFITPPEPEPTTPIEKSIAAPLAPQQSLPQSIELPSQDHIKEQFQELLNHDLDLGLELAKIGAQTFGPAQGKPRYRVISSSASVFSGVSESAIVNEPDEYTSIVSAIHQSANAISRQDYVDPEVITEPTLASVSMELPSSVASDVHEFYSASLTQFIKKPSPPSGSRRLPKIKFKFLLFSAGALVVIGLIVRYGFQVKNEVIDQSAAAVTNLQTAQEDLKALDFKNAAQDFFSAYAHFSKAGDTLNVFGASLTNIISSLPGGGTLKSAKNLLEVGQLLSAAGTSMTTALDSVSRTGALYDLSNPNIPLGQIISTLKKALISSQQQVAKASSLMADIDSSIIPEDKRASFEEFKAKLPDFQNAINMSTDYAKFFENLITTKGNRKYLVMFQNSSELRPTGGFPGTYAVISFSGGKLESIFVDDIYNLDGQLKENIIPPLQMQHITPTWGMRDANWYIDFPTSARNIASFYKKESGKAVDGVIVINPEMVPKILEIIGPVDMPRYKLTLTSKNVLTAIQDQVEYGPNRTQPKQIVKDFAPLFLSKIYSSGSDKWLAIFNTLVLSMNQHDVMMNFNDLSLQSFVTDKGFSGQVYHGPEDYLMATITNIKGSKTDAVTDTSMSLDTAFESDSAIHTLTITREHKGGAEKYGFYNKQNPAYVRVLVPEGAELISIGGNDKPNFKPLIDYSQANFVRDENLTKFETSGITNKDTGVTTYKEARRGEFGFWLITDPANTKSVTLKYRVPKAIKDKTYSLYLQKQPSLKIKNFSFAMQKPEGLAPEASAPLLTLKDNSYTYSSVLENDMTFKVNFK